MSSGGKKCIYVHMIGLYIRDVHVGRNYRGHIDDIGRGSRKLCPVGSLRISFSTSGILYNWTRNTNCKQTVIKGLSGRLKLT